MTIERFKRHVKASPFEPFDIYLADGRVMRVDHPENAILAENGRTFELFGRGDSREVFSLMMVVSLKPMPAEKST